MDELSRDMQMVCDIIGDDATEKLINELGGVSIYIPKPQVASTEEVIATLRSCRQDVKITARRLGLSQSRVYTILREYREAQLNAIQGNLFE